MKKDMCKGYIEAPCGWHIEKNTKPIPMRDFDFDFWHDDYDADIDGDNGLCGNASSYQDALEQISQIESDPDSYVNK